MAEVKNSIVLVCMGVGNPGEFANWEDGPLPVKGLVAQQQGPATIEATVERRKTAFHERVFNILYPDHVVAADHALRRHHWVSKEEYLEIDAGMAVIAAEILFYETFLPPAIMPADKPAAILLLHCSITQPISQSLVRSVSVQLRDRTGREQTYQRIEKWLPSADMAGFKVDKHRPPYTVAFGIISDATERIDIEGTAFAEWNLSEQWTWLMASWTPPEVFAPASVKDDTGSSIALSSTFSVRVLRDGAAFVALDKNPDGTENRSLSSLSLYARTIYVDALALGIIQSGWLNAFADEVAGAAASVQGRLETVEALDRAMSHFRATIWWRSAAYGSHGDKLISAFQEQHHLPELLRASSSEVDDLVRQERTAIERRSLETSRQTELSLSLVTAVGLPLVPVFTVWSTISGTWWGLIPASGAYFASSLLLGAVVYPRGRQSVRRAITKWQKDRNYLGRFSHKSSDISAQSCRTR